MESQRKIIVRCLFGIFLIFSCGDKNGKDVCFNKDISNVELIGDSIRIEYAQKGNITIRYFMRLDSAGNPKFINATVSEILKIAQRPYGTSAGDEMCIIKGYEVHFPVTSLDSIEGKSEMLRKGYYRCFRNKGSVDQTYLIEERIEGNGTYVNILSMVVPGRNDTVEITKYRDNWLLKSYSWNPENLRPMSMKEYREKRRRIQEFTKDWH